MSKVREQFIVFEGTDGSGTSTQIDLFATFLRKHLNKDVEVFGQPSKGPIGKLIRSFLSENKPPELAMAMLFAADRAVQREQFRALLDNDTYVLCDRDIVSSLVYQGIAVNEVVVEFLNSSFFLPDITFFLDVSPAVAIERINSRKSHKEVYENGNTSAH